MRTDRLLADYAQGGSEEAFRSLVAAYLDLVYSTAARLTGGDMHLAEDVFARRKPGRTPMGR
jgi:DNA-directed RNA polymerase specialized sigma subunit